MKQSNGAVRQISSLIGTFYSSFIMMKTFLGVMTLILVSCQMNDQEDIHIFKGLWKYENKDVYELWTLQKERSLKGESYIQKDSIRHITETMELYFQDDQYVYDVIVKNQNQGATIRFPLISKNRQTYIFENLDHDFPQRIAYRFVSEDSLNVIISNSDRRDTIIFMRQN